MTEVCGNCLFWKKWNETGGPRQTHGNCRRGPGQVVVVRNGSDDSVKTKQPLKHEGEWCGDWEPSK